MRETPAEHFRILCEYHFAFPFFHPSTYALNLSVSLFRLALLRFNESVFPFFFSAVFLYMRSKRSVWLLLGNSSSMHPTISQIQLVWAACMCAFMLLLVLVLEPPPLPSLWLSMSMALTLTLTYENHAFSHECSCAAAAVAVIIKYYIVFAWLVFLRLFRV